MELIKDRVYFVSLLSLKIYVSLLSTVRLILFIFDVLL